MTIESAPNGQPQIKGTAKNLSIDCPLTKVNYHLWSFKMIPMLENEGILTYQETNVVLSDTSHAKRALIVNISNELTMQVSHCTTAQQICDSFYKLYTLGKIILENSWVFNVSVPFKCKMKCKSQFPTFESFSMTPL